MFEKYKLNKKRRKLEMKRLDKYIELIESSDFSEEDDSSWNILGNRKEFYSETEITDMQEKAKKLFYTNPLARGIIRLIVNFAVGNRCEVHPVDKNIYVNEYWDNFIDLNKFDLKLKEILRRILRDGEVFIRRFRNNDISNPNKIRFIDPNEIRSDIYSYGIRTNPDDVEEVISYHREFTIDGITKTEVIPADEIIHYKYNVDSNEKRGISFFIGIAKDIVSYRNWLDDRIHLNRLRSMFALTGSPNKSSVTSTKDLFNDSSYMDSQNDSYKKKMIKSGSVLIDKGIEWDFKSPNLQAWDTRYDGRAILLMIAAGSGGLPEYMVTGDASNASYSSTLVSESPGVKLFESFQDILHNIIDDIFSQTIEDGIKSGELPTHTMQTKFDDGENSVKVNKETNLNCSVTFPILIHRNILDDTNAIKIQVELGLLSKQTAAEELGREYDKEKLRMEQDENKKNEEE